MSIIKKYHNQTHGTAGKSHTTITSHQEDKLSKATSSLFPIKMITKLERTKKHRTITDSHNGSSNKQRVKNNRTTPLEHPFYKLYENYPETLL